MERQDYHFFIVISCVQTDSNEALTKSCERALKYHRKKEHLVRFGIWCIHCPSSLVEHARQITTNVIDTDVSIFSNLSMFLSCFPNIADREMLLFCSCGVIFEDNYIKFLSRKIEEYEGKTILSAFGIRLFPHKKLQNVSESLVKGIHWKLYNDNETDRQVHIFCPNMCIISFPTLCEISKHYDNTFSKGGTIWQSYVASDMLNPMVPVWKIQTTGIINFSGTDLECSCNLLSMVDDCDKETFKEIYSFIYQSNWPKGIADPLWNNTGVLSSNNDDPVTMWQNTFGGVNMSINPASELDFAAAAAYGIKVIRVGAVCDAKDLNYLLDPHSSTSNDDKCHLLKVLPRLRTGILKANKYGLKVLLTMADLPGCNFHSGSSSIFWESSSCRSRVVKFWGYLAQALTGLQSGIMGYDPINEPYTTEDTEVQYFDDMPMYHAEELHMFYSDVLREIRKYDQQVKIVVKGLWFASPRAIESIRPLSDSNVVYAFHMYTPPFLTLQRRFGSPGFSYPGFVPHWLNCPYDKGEITRTFIYDLLKDTVYNWQVKHCIPSNQILVAEFGICREVHGACEYLTDVLAIFQEFKWSWLLFSFRDDEWDALDYELGTDMNNMLYRSATKLFLNVAKHFH